MIQILSYWQQKSADNVDGRFTFRRLRITFVCNKKLSIKSIQSSRNYVMAHVQPYGSSVYDF